MIPNISELFMQLASQCCSMIQNCDAAFGSPSRSTKEAAQNWNKAQQLKSAMAGDLRSKNTGDTETCDGRGRAPEPPLAECQLASH